MATRGDFMASVVFIIKQALLAIFWSAIFVAISYIVNIGQNNETGLRSADAHNPHPQTQPWWVSSAQCPFGPDDKILKISGAGISGVNGIYYLEKRFNERPCYHHKANKYLLWYSAQMGWVISSGLMKTDFCYCSETGIDNWRTMYGASSPGPKIKVVKH